MDFWAKLPLLPMVNSGLISQACGTVLMYLVRLYNLPSSPHCITSVHIHSLSRSSRKKKKILPSLGFVLLCGSQLPFYTTKTQHFI